MDDQLLEAASALVPQSFLKAASQGAQQQRSALKALLSSRRLPALPWRLPAIRSALAFLSSLDHNNHMSALGVGEREARLQSAVVEQRCFGLAHGMGRSGDLSAAQPKAAGSSLLVALSNALVLSLLKEVGARSCVAAVVMPVATGMSVALCLIALRESEKEARRRRKREKRELQQRTAAGKAEAEEGGGAVSVGAGGAAEGTNGVGGGEKEPKRKIVVWSRCDQKSCFKALLISGFKVRVLQTVVEGDSVKTDMEALTAMLEAEAAHIACVVSTTSCFAPRAPDDVVGISKLCQKHGVSHLINNAYGVQSRVVMKLIERAMCAGRVDFFVQSTDKNFMVPVGGAVVAGPSAERVTSVAKSYAGRASSSSVIDLFITMLSFGRSGYADAVERREKLFDYMVQQLEAVAEDVGERVLRVANNRISVGFTLSGCVANPTLLGSMLFSRGVTGHRVVQCGNVKELTEKHRFRNWGAHCNAYAPCAAYMTVSVALGMTREDVDNFLKKLRKTVLQLQKKERKKKTSLQEEADRSAAE